jgi:hypothetical protein
MAAGYQGRFAELAPLILALLAQLASQKPLASAARLMLTEAQSFPDLARDWCGQVLSDALDLVAGLIAGAQERGEIRPGDPRAYAMSLVGPVLAAILWRGAFDPTGPAPIDLPALARQHADAVLHGMMAAPP